MSLVFLLLPTIMNMQETGLKPKVLTLMAARMLIPFPEPAGQTLLMILIPAAPELVSRVTTCTAFLAGI